MPLLTPTFQVEDAVSWMTGVEERGEMEWLVEGMVPKGGVCLMSGQQKRAMKTFSSIEMAVSIATGTPFGGEFKTRQGGVLVIAEEGSPHAYKNRLDACLAGRRMGRHVLEGRMYVAFRNMIKLDNEAWRKTILTAAEKYQPSLIIFDSLYRMIEGDENKQEDANKALDTLMKLANGQFASLVICHLDKTRGSSEKPDIDDQVRGSGVITNGYDAHIALRRYDAKQKHVDLIVRPREAEEFERDVVWKLKSRENQIISSQMEIKEKLGRKGASNAKNETRHTRMHGANRLPALPQV